MPFVILMKRDNEEELDVYGPFNTLGEIDDWENHFCELNVEYQVTEMTLEPKEYISFCAGIKAMLELKHNLYIEKYSDFDFLGYWQAKIDPYDVIKLILKQCEES